MSTGPWAGQMLSPEMLAVFVVLGLVALVYIATKVHLDSKQNAREHAELRSAIGRLGALIDRRFNSTDCQFDSIDRKLDQILAHLIERPSDEDD